MDWVLRGERIRQERHRLLEDIHAEVLEIGFGTVLNLPHYPRTITRLHATDPARFLPNRVAARIAQVGFPVHMQQTGVETLPYEDNRFDFVISMFTLCTVSDPIASLRECRRVLSAGGSLIFLEHGRSEHSRIAKWKVAGSTQRDSECFGLRLQSESLYCLDNPASGISTQCPGEVCVTGCLRIRR